MKKFVATLVVTIAVLACASRKTSVVVSPVSTPCYELCTANECIVDCTKLPSYRQGVHLRAVYVTKHGKIVRY